MSFVADLRDAIHGFHFTDRRLSQLPTPQAASSSGASISNLYITATNTASCKQLWSCLQLAVLVAVIASYLLAACGVGSCDSLLSVKWKP